MLKLVVFFLNQEEHLEEVLEAFVEMGINGATILDSIGMGRILAHDIPIFAGFQNLLHDTRPGNKTILTVVPEEKIELIIQSVEHIVGSLDEPGNGIILSLPIEKFWGYSNH